MQVVQIQNPVLEWVTHVMTTRKKKQLFILEKAQEPLWSVQDCDTSKSFEALTKYLQLGSDRSLAKVEKAMGKKSGYVRQLEKWSADHGWSERARAFDAYEAERLLEVAESKVIARIAKERIALMERELDLSKKMMVYSENYIEAATAQISTYEERLRIYRRDGDDSVTKSDVDSEANDESNDFMGTITQKPHAGIAAAAKVGETGSKLGRLATGMKTESIALHNTSGVGRTVTTANGSSLEIPSTKIGKLTQKEKDKIVLGQIDLDMLDPDELALLGSVLDKATEKDRENEGESEG